MAQMQLVTPRDQMKTSVRNIMGAPALVLTGWMCLIHDHGGVKGSFVPLEVVLYCLIASALAAHITCRGWHWLPAPFVAGVVAGLIAGMSNPVGLASPYGGILGLAVGVVVVVLEQWFTPTQSTPVEQGH